MALGLSGGAGFLAGRRSGGDAMESALAAHVRGLQPGHAIDVVSADGHTVKPWFDGKVDFSPPVKDLGDAGFALIGGRLDYVDRHVAAVIVYRRRQHQIDLFVWPEASAGAATATVDGYHARSWPQDGFSFWAVSDLNEFGAGRIRAPMARRLSRSQAVGTGTARGRPAASMATKVNSAWVTCELASPSRGRRQAETRSFIEVRPTLSTSA